MKKHVMLAAQFVLLLMVSCTGDFVKSDAAAKIGCDPALLEGVIQAGTLGNAQLVRDTMLPLMGKLGALGCEDLESYTPFVIQMPEGDVGSRVWKERWVIKADGKFYAVNIVFSETGPYGVNIRIE